MKIDTEKQLKLNARLVIKEQNAFDRYLDDKPNKWWAWKRLINLNNDIMEYTNFFGV